VNFGFERALELLVFVWFWFSRPQPSLPHQQCGLENKPLAGERTPPWNPDNARIVTDSWPTRNPKKHSYGSQHAAASRPIAAAMPQLYVTDGQRQRRDLRGLSQPNASRFGFPVDIPQQSRGFFTFGMI
jgi:hypothetical protein